MIKIIKEEFSSSRVSREQEYYDYLDQHVSSVKRAWEEILYPALLIDSDYTADIFTSISENIENHDKSKYSEEEFDPYLNYFYPLEGKESPKDEFNYAWLHHQKVNPHHWQYWILVNDDDGTNRPLDIPFEYVCEMLCDWSSFHYFKDPKSTANQWYKDNKDRIILSDNTRQLVEELLNLCPDL